MASERDEFPWHLGVYDAHCHPTDVMSRVDRFSNMKAQGLIIMSSRSQDQDLVAEVSSRDLSDGKMIVPSFGLHPWFSHEYYIDGENAPSDPKSEEFKIQHYKSVLQPPKSLSPLDLSGDKALLDSLPQPRPFSVFLSETRRYLEDNPLALVGEIGLDAPFQVPDPWTPEAKAARDQSLTPGGKEGRPRSRFHVTLRHQQKLFYQQLVLAGEMQRAVSVHCVRAPMATFDSLNLLAAKAKPAPFPPRICLHSYSGSAEYLKGQFLKGTLPATVYVSLSAAINMSDNPTSMSKTEEVIRHIPDGQILSESDLHMAGDKMNELLERICRKICEVKGWSLEEGVEQLGGNWMDFINIYPGSDGTLEEYEEGDNEDEETNGKTGEEVGDEDMSDMLRDLVADSTGTLSQFENEGVSDPTCINNGHRRLEILKKEALKYKRMEKASKLIKTENGLNDPVNTQIILGKDLGGHSFSEIASILNKYPPYSLREKPVNYNWVHHQYLRYAYPWYQARGLQVIGLKDPR